MTATTSNFRYTDVYGIFIHLYGISGGCAPTNYTAGDSRSFYIGTPPPTASAANAPTILATNPYDGQVAVAFTAPTDTGGSAITNYEYSKDGGTNYNAFNPAVTASPVVITGLNNGTSYSIKLRAVNSVGVGAESAAVTSTPAATSNAPTSLATTPGDGKVSVAFTAPTDTGGSAITNYEYSKDGGTNYTAFNPAVTASPVVITGLTNGTSYSIKLRAVNSAGVGAESAAVTSTPAATSNAPTALATTPGDGQVSVAFTAPTSNGGSAITDYEYQLDGGDWTTASTTSSPVIITGLTNGTGYSIKLRAVNSLGVGAESAAVTSTPAATSNAPTSLATTPGDGKVSVAFTAPTSNGGSAITDYEYQLDGGDWTTASTTSSPVIITGLTNGTSYSIKLRAVNSLGVGAESAAVTSTPAATSNAPTALAATPGDGQVSVAFTAPTSNGGSAITDYEYQLDGGDWTTASTTSSPVIITGLTQRYQLQHQTACGKLIGCWGRECCCYKYARSDVERPNMP